MNASLTSSFLGNSADVVESVSFQKTAWCCGLKSYIEEMDWNVSNPWTSLSEYLYPRDKPPHKINTEIVAVILSVLALKVSLTLHSGAPRTVLVHVRQNVEGTWTRMKQLNDRWMTWVKYHDTINLMFTFLCCFRLSELLFQLWKAFTLICPVGKKVVPIILTAHEHTVTPWLWTFAWQLKPFATATR